MILLIQNILKNNMEFSKLYSYKRKSPYISILSESSIQFQIDQPWCQVIWNGVHLVIHICNP